MDSNDRDSRGAEKEELITFLTATKEGKYAKIDEPSLSYSRMEEETLILENQYYYSIT